MYKRTHLTLMMTSAQVVEMSVNVASNSPSQDYTHPDDRTPLSYDMTPGFKPFTIVQTYVGNVIVLSQSFQVFIGTSSVPVAVQGGKQCHV